MIAMADPSKTPTPATAGTQGAQSVQNVQGASRSPQLKRIPLVTASETGRAQR